MYYYEAKIYVNGWLVSVGFSSNTPVRTKRQARRILEVSEYNFVSFREINALLYYFKSLIYKWRSYRRV